MSNPALKLSKRGEIACNPPLEYLAECYAAFGNIYDPKDNPLGKVVLAIAENTLSFDILKPVLSRVASNDIPLSVAKYDNMKGIFIFRQQIANFLREGKGFGSYEFKPEGVIISPGCGAIIEQLVHCLCDPGDVILIPAPYYPSFDRDLTAKCGAVPFPVKTKAPEFVITPALLDAALEQCRCNGQVVRAVLITNPHNPLGTLYSRSTLTSIIQWSRDNKVHLISDEIYAFSVHSPTKNFENNQKPETVFQSVSSLCGESLGDWIHILCLFSFQMSILALIFFANFYCLFICTKS